MAQMTSTMDFASVPNKATAIVSRPEPEHARIVGMPSGQTSRHTSLTLESATSIVKTSVSTGQSSASSIVDHDVANIAPTSSTRPSLAVLLAYTALCISIFLVALDTVLIPTALPTISESFHIADSLYAWTGSAYLLANASSIPLWGTLADVFGRKPILLVANIIFLVGSVVCAVSVNAPMLVGGRAIQGLGGGGVNCLVYVCVSDLFTLRYVTSVHCMQ